MRSNNLFEKQVVQCSPFDPPICISSEGDNLTASLSATTTLKMPFRLVVVSGFSALK